MVGLSVVLEARNCSNLASKRSPQVISKATLMINKPSFSSPLAAFGLPDFLQHCSLCRQKLSPGEDIYMYKGDRAFCSVECRCRQIFMDEEEILTKDNCSLAAIKPAAVSSPAAASSSRSSGRRKSTRNRAGGFAY